MRTNIIRTITRLLPVASRAGKTIDKKIHINVLAPVVLSAALVLVWFFFVRGHTVAILHPQGLIASEQRNLLYEATILMLVIVVPVFALTFFIAWRYRDGGKKRTYTPDWDHHNELEFIWWALPCLIILALGSLAWRTSHDLDPYRPIAGRQPLTIQVVALQWKWLFIYPDQRIATVNYLEVPEGTPLNFQITADAPMNSFWIPELGGQVYAMSGMTTKLHLVADHAGTYRGVSANLSGGGFAGMHFDTVAVSNDDFTQWVHDTQGSPGNLGMVEYKQLAKPSTNNSATSFALLDQSLYDKILMNYMAPVPSGSAHHDGDK